jgi:predicted SnoaL-like aldol condensation-catalyzing enzyme
MRNGFTTTNTETGKAAIVKMFASFEDHAFAEDLDTIKTMSALDLATVVSHALMAIEAYASVRPGTYDVTEHRVIAAKSAHVLALSELARRAEVAK